MLAALDFLVHIKAFAWNILFTAFDGLGAGYG
jgi:hypothetical protein